MCVSILFHFVVMTMAKCLNSDSVCGKKKITLQKGIDEQRKRCISDVPNAKRNGVKTVMCRDRCVLEQQKVKRDM